MDGGEIELDLQEPPEDPVGGGLQVDHLDPPEQGVADEQPVVHVLRNRRVGGQEEE